jgi:hypothetical protein
MEKFPPKLPNSVYSSVFLTPLLLFTSLTDKETFLYIQLLSLVLLFISIPLSFCEEGYPPSLSK